MSPLLLLGLDVLEPRVLRKQPLYLHEVVVRSAYTLPSPDTTLWDFSGYVGVVCIAQLGALQTLDLSDCKRLRQLPGFTGMQYLDTLDLSFCNLTAGGLPEDIGSLSSLKELNLCGNNFEHLPRSIAQLGALRTLDLSHCKRLTQLPEFPQQLHTIRADWSNDWIFNSLFQNISALQHEISASDSLSLRVFTSWPENIPSWFHHQGMGENV
ncbi:hypothetical protein KY289_007307 [Solanum tuberosum]|nr:hypothetical protein KY289_007307 [Solanum tuberosum]